MAVRLFHDFRLAWGTWLARPQQAFRQNDRLQALDRFLEIVVNQNIVVLVIVSNLTSGRDQTAGDHLFGVFAALAQAPLQRFSVWRQDKNADRLGQLSFHLLGALHVNVEQKVVFFFFRLAQEPAGCAVVIPEDIGMLEKLVIANHLLKFLAGNELVLLAVLLAAPWRTRGIRDRKIQIGNQLQQFVDQSRLPRTGGRRNNADQRPVV